MFTSKLHKFSLTTVHELGRIPFLCYCNSRICHWQPIYII